MKPLMLPLLYSLFFGTAHAGATDVAGSSQITSEPAKEQGVERVQDNVLEEQVVPMTPAYESGEVNAAWLDIGTSYLESQANDLTKWADSYFGGTEQELEAAYSRLRLRFIGNIDERRDNEFKVRVGGKVNLPAISRRLDLVFRGDEPDDMMDGEDPMETRVGLQYQLGKLDAFTRGRWDLTLGANSSGLKPGVRYRYFNDLSERNTLHFTQRLQYDSGDPGFTAISRLDLDHELSERRFLRSLTRVLKSEDSDGYEWNTSLGYFSRWMASDRPHLNKRASYVYASVEGITEPTDTISNYKVGWRYRRQSFRDYLFLEFEPSYNWRIDEAGIPREGAWRVELRAEFLLYEDDNAF